MDLKTYRNTLQQTGSFDLGEIYKKQSDMVMEETWNRDIAAKQVYLYDYFRDDSPALSKGMTYGSTTKTKLSAKFLVKSYSSISKDQVEYYLQFKPSQKTSFVDGDDLYYYETEFVNRYRAEFPIGLYVDIPDEKNVYRRWLICDAGDYGNQFIKYLILPCNYKLQWIEQSGDKRIKRQMWCVLRSQNSYNSGLWTDQYFTSVENQLKAFLPMNTISQNIYYTHINGDETNQRVIVSALTPTPSVWQISKVESANPFGLQKITLYQDSFNPNTDYVNLETGEMYADYYSTGSVPTETPEKIPAVPDEGAATVACTLSASSAQIKVGGSYKLVTATFSDSNEFDVTDSYKDLITPDSWSVYIGDSLASDQLYTINYQTDPNKIKIKFLGDESYLANVLTVRCTVNTTGGTTLVGELNLDIVSI